MRRAWPFSCSGGLGGIDWTVQYILKERVLCPPLPHVFPERSREFPAEHALADQPFLQHVGGGPVATLPGGGQSGGGVPERLPTDPADGGLVVEVVHEGAAGGQIDVAQGGGRV